MMLRLSSLIPIAMVSLVALPLAGFSAEPQGSQFHYFARIPHAAISCAQQAQALADRFSKATSLIVLQASCVGSPVMKADGKSYVLDSLDLIYSADAEVTPNTTTIGSIAGVPYMPDVTAVDYSTFAECVADIQTQRALYTSATGLDAVSTTCAPDPAAVHSQYFMAIDGFGQATERLQALELGIEGSPDAAFRKASLELIENSGGTLARVNGGIVLYYSADPTTVSQLWIADFDVAAQCKAEEAEARTILTGAGASTVIVDCLPTEFSRGVSLEVIYAGGSAVSSDSGVSAPQYYSYAECAADRARALQAIEDEWMAPLGGICHPSDSQTGEWELDVFTPQT